MEHGRRTWFDDRGLVLASGRTLPCYAGAMHYWRLPPARWTPCLRAMHSLGLTLVDAPVPWRVHEPDPGARLWTGEHDLSRFLDEASAAGLHVVLRLGPSTQAETSFGIPDWVLAEPECQASTARGTPAWLPVPPRAFPIPSYASAKFRGLVKRWFATVAEIVGRHLGKPVVAIDVDRDPYFFREGAFDLDYHPDALAWWRDASGLDEPPREWRDDDAARCALWLKFKADYAARAHREFSALLDDAGLGGLARVPPAVTAFAPRTKFPDVRRRAAAMAVAGVGFHPWLEPLDERDDPTRERDQLLSLLAGGSRGFSLVMAVERDRHYGAAIDARGQIEVPWIAPLVTALAEIEWPSLRRQPLIALVDTRADARFGILTNVVDPVPPVLAELLGIGPAGAAELGRDRDAIASRRWHTAIARALELAQVPYAIVDESAGEDELARYRAVIAPTLHRIDRGLWHRLRALAEHKRAVVVIGPGTPVRDELDQPLDEPAPKRIGKLKQGSLEDLAGLAEDLASLAGETSEDWHVERPDEVRAMAFSDATGAVRVVFVVSDAERTTTAVLLAGAAGALRDAFTHEHLPIEGGRVSLAMPARSVRMLIVW